MKRNVLILTVLFLFALTGIVVADVNGYFNGYPIVNVKVNGNAVNGDTPAIVFNGRTMVPISLVTQAIGGNVEWDQATETASIYVRSGETGQDDINKLKLYSEIANNYNRLCAAGEMIGLYSEGLSMVYDDFKDNGDPGSINKMLDSFNDTVSGYNLIIADNNYLVNKARSNNIDISDTLVIINKYNAAVDYYKIAFEGLISFTKTQSKADFDKAHNNSDTAFNLSLQGQGIATDSYYQYYSMIQNY